MPTTIETILDQLYFSATDTRDQGDKFERLMVQFFKTDVEWSARFDEVWSWMSWPGRPHQADHGVDLVARERDTGDLVAIQCKFYDPAATISKQDIDSFLSESGKHPFRGRIVVTTTDHWGRNAEQAIAGARTQRDNRGGQGHCPITRDVSDHLSSHLARVRTQR